MNYESINQDPEQQPKPQTQKPKDVTAAFFSGAGLAPKTARIQRHWLDAYTAAAGGVACWSAIGHLAGAVGCQPSIIIPTAFSVLPSRGKISHWSFQQGEWTEKEGRSVIHTDDLVRPPHIEGADGLEIDPIPVMLRVAAAVRVSDREPYLPTFHIRRWTEKQSNLGIRGFAGQVQVIKPVCLWIPCTGTNPGTAQKLGQSSKECPRAERVYNIVRAQTIEGKSEEEAEALVPSAPTPYLLALAARTFRENVMRGYSPTDHSQAEAAYKGLASAHHTAVEESLTYIRNRAAAQHTAAK
jgi:hypothetical protein